MFAAAMKAFSQMFSPPFRRVLWKSIGLALILIVLIGVGLHRLLLWLGSSGEVWAEGFLGPTAVSVVAWTLSIATGLRIIAG